MLIFYILCKSFHFSSIIDFICLVIRLLYHPHFASDKSNLYHKITPSNQFTLGLCIFSTQCQKFTSSYFRQCKSRTMLLFFFTLFLRKPSHQILWCKFSYLLCQQKFFAVTVINTLIQLLPLPENGFQQLNHLVIQTLTFICILLVFMPLHLNLASLGTFEGMKFRIY